MIRMFTNVKFSQALSDTLQDSAEPSSSSALAAARGEGALAISSNYWRNKSLPNISLLEPFIFPSAGVSLPPPFPEGVNYPSASPRELARTVSLLDIK